MTSFRSPMQSFAGRASLLLAAVLFSTGGAVIKGTQFSNWQVAGFRSALAAAVIFALMPDARRRWSVPHLAAGLAYCGTMLLFVGATKLTTAANAIFLQSTASLYLLLAGPFLLKEPVQKRDLWVLALLAAGMAMFFVGSETPVSTAPDPSSGNILAALAGLTWAATVAGFRWLERDDPGSGAPAIVLGNLIAVAVCLPMALPVRSAAATDWLAVAFLGLFQVGLAYFFLARGVRTTPALEASLILLAEPALNPLWAWLVHGEVPSTWANAGGALILAGTVARAALATKSPVRAS